MSTYTYEALTDAGNAVNGTVEADSPDHARRLVADRGFIPTKVRKASGKAARAAVTKGGWQNRFVKIKPEDLILFTKQFRTMLSAGVAVLQIMEVLEAQTDNPKLKAAIISIGQDLRSGKSLHRAFAKHQDIFSRLYCNMIQAGESSGTLIDVLDRLIYIVEHENKVKKDIKSALTYPIIVMVALAIAFVVLILFVFPNFIVLFEDAGIELPLPTRICVGLYEMFSTYWLPTLVGFGAGVFGFSAWLKTDKGRLAWDGFLLRLPVLGKIFTKAAMSRFGSIFAILQSSGVTILESVDIISGTIGNAAISKEFMELKEKLEQGKGISEPLRGSRFFAPMMISMIAIGEESGQLEEMLREAAAHYDYEVEYSVSRMSELIAPALTAGLAGVVGFFAFAIFLPLIDLMTNSLGGL